MCAYLKMCFMCHSHQHTCTDQCLVSDSVDVFRNIWNLKGWHWYTTASVEISKTYCWCASEPIAIKIKWWECRNWVEESETERWSSLATLQFEHFAVLLLFHYHYAIVVCMVAEFLFLFRSPENSILFSSVSKCFHFNTKRTLWQNKRCTCFLLPHFELKSKTSSSEMNTDVKTNHSIVCGE